MSRVGWGVALGLCAWALGAAEVGARPRPRPRPRPMSTSGSTSTPIVREEGGPAILKFQPKKQAPPLRVVINVDGHPLANCVFALAEVGERAAPDAPTRKSFNGGESIWGRCYLPDRLGTNAPGDLVDVITVDGKRVWEQKYDRAVPADALARLVPYHAVLRGVLDRLPRGTHRVEVDGMWKRGRSKRLYHGEFGYVR